MQSHQVTWLQVVGPAHLVSVLDPYLMKGVVVVGVGVEDCRLSCLQSKKGSYHKDGSLSRHRPVCIIVTQ